MLLFGLGFYSGCHASVARTILLPGHNTHDTTSVRDTVPVVQTKYIKGASFAILDTIYAPIPGQWRVDTLVTEKVVTVTKNIYVHDTTYLPQSASRYVFLNTPFETPHQNTVELAMCVEHDFLSGYGADAEIDINLDKLHATNLVLYGSAGGTRLLTTHGEGRLAVGLKGVLTSF